MKASRELDYEGMMDDNMESMFKPTGTKIEMGRKSIQSSEADINLKGKAYQGIKKVSRSELVVQDQSEDESEELGSDEMGESEMISEGGESEMSQSSSQSSQLDDLDKNAKLY